MRFSITRLIKNERVHGETPPLIVDGERWWCCRTIGIMHFGCGPEALRFEQTTHAAHIETRWAGVDNGGAIGRRMQFRLRGKKKWQEIDEYDKDIVNSAM